MLDQNGVRSQRLPWEIFPALTAERLRVAAAIIRDVRTDAIKGFEPSKGDIPWNLACTCYARTIHQIERASSLTKYGGWLSVIEHVGLAFTFGIGGVPIKFFCGEPDQPSERAIHRRVAELEAYWDAVGLLDMPNQVDTLGLVFRLVVTIKDLLVSRITLVQVDDKGGVYNPYRIDLDGAPVVVQLDTKRKAIEVPPLPVPRRREKAEKGMAQHEANRDR